MNNDFYPKMKVSLDGEYGIVLDEFREWDGIYFVDGEKHQRTPSKSYGLIRWDSNKENDIEDWRGTYGTFINSGGKEISQDHQFEYINDDGTLKNH